MFSEDPETTMKLMILTLVTGLSLIHACPEFCNCSANYHVTCVGLKDVPSDLPLSTVHLQLFKLDIEEMTRWAFGSLPNLTKLEIDDSKIGVIRNCAFEGLKDMEEISISGTDINVVDSNAFRNVISVTKLRIEYCRIGEIRSFAFNNIHDVKVWKMKNLTIAHVYTSSFYNISKVDKIKLMSSSIVTYHSDAMRYLYDNGLIYISRNHFEIFECQKMKELGFNSTLVDRVLFSDNLLTCNCSLRWLIQLPRNDRVYKNIFESNRCAGPGTLAREENLKGVSVVSLDCPMDGNNETYGCPFHNAHQQGHPRAVCQVHANVAVKLDFGISAALCPPCRQSVLLALFVGFGTLFLLS